MKTRGVLLLFYLLGSGVGSKCWVMSEMIMPFEYTSTGDTSSCSETHSNVTYFQYDRNQAPFTTKQHRVRWSQEFKLRPKLDHTKVLEGTTCNEGNSWKGEVVRVGFTLKERAYFGADWKSADLSIMGLLGWRKEMWCEKLKMQTITFLTDYENILCAFGEQTYSVLLRPFTPFDWTMLMMNFIIWKRVA